MEEAPPGGCAPRNSLEGRTGSGGGGGAWAGEQMGGFTAPHLPATVRVSEEKPQPWGSQPRPLKEEHGEPLSPAQELKANP